VKIIIDIYKSVRVSQRNVLNIELDNTDTYQSLDNCIFRISKNGKITIWNKQPLLYNTVVIQLEKHFENIYFVRVNGYKFKIHICGSWADKFKFRKGIALIYVKKSDLVNKYINNYG